MRPVAGARAAWTLAAALAPALVHAADEPPPNAVRIECKGSAEKYGDIVLAFLENGAEVSRIPVPIPEGTPENAIADRMRKEVRRALPRGEYEVEVDDGEVVVVTARDPAKVFEIRVASNPVEGTEVTAGRE
jgi:type IV pilus biogenesis protein CpaD/CtpE